MNLQIQVDFPSELSNLLHLQEAEFSQEMKRLALIKLFELGKISSGKAAQILKMSRLDFFELLMKYGVDIYNDVSVDFLQKDKANA